MWRDFVWALGSAGPPGLYALLFFNPRPYGRGYYMSVLRTLGHPPRWTGYTWVALGLVNSNEIVGREVVAR
jgi:hypothetical protein